MGFFGGKTKQQQIDNGTNPNYVNVDDSALPVAVAINAKDPEVGLHPPSSPTVKMNTTPTYHATTHKKQPMGLEFTTRFPTVIPQCPNCSALNVQTTTRTFPTFLTWVAVLIMVIIFWPLCWLPLVLDQCRHTTHICTKCHSEIGQVQAFNDCCVKHRY